MSAPFNDDFTLFELEPYCRNNERASSGGPRERRITFLHPLLMKFFPTTRVYTINAITIKLLANGGSFGKT